MWEKLGKLGSEYCVVLLLRSAVFIILTPGQEKTTLDYYAIQAELRVFEPVIGFPPTISGNSSVDNVRSCVHNMPSI